MPFSTRIAARWRWPARPRTSASCATSPVSTRPALDGLLHYANTSGKPFAAKRRDTLAHVFNHQTHHRGQAHGILSILTGREPPVLDLLAMQRGVPAPDLRALAAS